MSMPAEDMGDDSGEFGDASPGYSWAVSVEDVALDSLESQVMKRIDVRVIMSESEQVYNLRSYRFPRD